MGSVHHNVQPWIVKFVWSLAYGAVHYNVQLRTVITYVVNSCTAHFVCMHWT